ncbi:hypothetical protein [Flagellimonas oceanensis]|uniref:hypothetical protein n=1 Tax=Flagellimonas oceanensis TaxID=2499163 RepID=UPI0013DFEE5E|nr:hypothetical protein [Allomuricauda oceanensis]
MEIYKTTKIFTPASLAEESFIEREPKINSQLVDSLRTPGVDTPKIRAVSLIIKFTEYDTKKVYPEVQDQGGIGSLERAA